MPPPISAVKKGIKFDSTLGTGVSTNLRLENLTLSSSLAGASANSVFIPPAGSIASSTADLMNFNAGGVLITVNPSNQTTSKIVSLIEGRFVDLGLEFDGLGMFRFVVSPGNDQPTVSAWLPEKTEHTIAVSYSASGPGITGTNILSVSIDGNSTQSIADFSSSDSTANLRVTLAGPASATDGSYDGFIGQLAFFKSEPSLSRLDIMTSNPDVLRTDFANVDLPALITGNDGSKTSFNRPEVQTFSVYGANTLTGAATSNFTFLGSTISLVASDTPATVAGRIVSSLAAIQAATSSVASITNSGAVLTVTYNSSADDVAETTAVSSSGMTVSNATETVKGIGPSIQQEIQKVVLTNITADAGTVKFLGIDSATLPKSSTPSTVVTGIITNKGSILAGDTAKALQIVDLTPGPNPGELLLTFSDNAGNVIGELKLVYNKTRQAAITKELSEIVSGAAAISG